jgi:hypothetical protein
VPHAHAGAFRCLQLQCARAVMTVFKRRDPARQDKRYPWAAKAILVNGVTASFRMTQADREAFRDVQGSYPRSPHFILIDSAGLFRVAVNLRAAAVIQLRRASGAALAIEPTDTKDDGAAGENVRVWTTQSRTPIDIPLTSPRIDVRRARPKQICSRNLSHFLGLQAVAFHKFSDKEEQSEVLHVEGPDGQVTFIEPVHVALIVAPTTVCVPTKAKGQLVAEPAPRSAH